ncbi:MAG: MoxR family ATPase [Clostridia bacterium]|nr:MoxR family ATPase [Clostridia bacterium]
MRFDYSPEVAEKAENANRLINDLIKEIESVVVGKHSEVVMLVTALLAGGHVLIEDVPGVGKTTLAATLSKAAGLKFNRAQFTPDVMASDITGFNIYNRQKEQFEFKSGLVMTNILLADEINRASPKTQSALLEAMEEGAVTVDGTTYPMPKPFMVIATQNPTGYIGTYPLPEAQLDRFILRLSMGYPNLTEEMSLISARRTSNPLSEVDAITDADSLNALRKMISEVTVSAEISKYIVTLVSATRTSPKISLGASPRASLALMKLSQAYAFIRGRDYVLAEDVSALYAPAVAHRIMLSQEARLEKKTAEDVLAELARGVEVPYRANR